MPYMNVGKSRKPKARTQQLHPMELALRLASQAGEKDEVPVGAVVVSEGKVIGRGANQREKRKDPLSHAEIHAISSASRKLKSWRLTGCTVFVTLEPCLMCLGALQQARVKSVVFATKDKKGGALSLGYPFHQDLRLNHRFELLQDPNPEFQERAAQLLKDFFRKKRSS